MSINLRKTGLFLLGAGAVGVLAAWIFRDPTSRYRLDLFSPNAFQRYSVLRYLAGEPATVDAITLMRDFVAWEPRSMLRERASQILARMEKELLEGDQES